MKSEYEIENKLYMKFCKRIVNNIILDIFIVYNNIA